MLLEILAAPALAYAAIVGYLAVRQRSFIFHPPAGHPDPGEMARAGFGPASGEGEGGATPRFWLSPPREPGDNVVVFLHGNASTVADGAAKLAPLREAGLGVMLVEYPGYGGAPGAPSEASILGQAEEALARLASAGTAPGRIVLWGESLGTGVATRLA
ncbi:MAG: alpha/beta fold hydrolase, partial [Alphaproteobacteria bacterium]